MSWLGTLQLTYRLDANGTDGAPRTVAHDRHSGPLRVLQRLYPEGDAICHHVLVHPPGGIVGGDELRIDADLGPGTHALITTPGATRFYRSNGATAVQDVNLRLAEGARLEWLPLETIAYDGCLAHNRLHATLAPGAEMMGCDILALGLPAADEAWRRGSYRQYVEIQDIWLDRCLIRADDARLLDSGPGWAGRRVLASLWFASGTALVDTRRRALVDSARAVIESDQANHPRNGQSSHLSTAGVSSAQPGLVVLRVLGSRVEPVQTLVRAIRQKWRALAWCSPRHTPRIWGT
ncbi:MAG: urease accessory protein UreD [Burkholderiales bacterium]|nr:urease accessory protein UreD [Burkholderiales bacterium]